MKFLLAVTLTFLFLSACNPSASSNRFPGFTQASKDGYASRFYAELDSVTRDQGGEVFFTMLRLVDGGYVIQKAATNCSESFRSDDGVKYRDDGTSDSKYLGDNNAIEFKWQSGLVALVKLVCDKAEEGRMIVGAFDDIKALEILYGPYNTKLKAALWQDMTPPKGMDIFEKREGFVSTVLSENYNENGAEKHLLVTSTRPNSQYEFNCHACVPLVGVTIFVKTGEKWRVEAHYPYSAVMGKYGEPPKMSWQRLGKDKFALLVEGGDMHQGYGSSYVSIYLLSEKELKTILNYVAEFDKDTYATISLVIGAVPSEGVSDIALSEERTDENSRKMQTIHQFRFANDKYEEIIKDTRESTVSISPLATAAPPAQTLNSLDQTVTKLLGFAGNPDESKIADVISAIEALPKPTKGDRKGARNLNEKALRLLQSGDPTGAISIFRQAVMADPSDQEVVNNLAYCYLQAERFTEAKRELGNTLLLAPRRSSAWANLGYLYAKTNDIPTAVRAFQHAYRFSSNQKKTLEYLHKQEDDQDSKVREATQLTLAAIGAQEKR